MADVVYRTTVRERTPARFAFQTLNVTVIEADLGLFEPDIAGPGAIERFRSLELLYMH